LLEYVVHCGGRFTATIYDSFNISVSVFICANRKSEWNQRASWLDVTKGKLLIAAATDEIGIDITELIAER
jgi:hypothetical protein